MAYALYQIIVILLDVLWWIIIIQIIMSWLIAFNVVNMGNDFVRTVMVALDRMTAPIYNPIRRVMPDLGALDRLAVGRRRPAGRHPADPRRREGRDWRRLAR